MTYIGIDSTGVGHGVYENVKALLSCRPGVCLQPQRLKTPRYSRPTTLSAAVWVDAGAHHDIASHSRQSVAPPPPAATARPMKLATAKPATPIWHEQQCTLFNEPLQERVLSTAEIF